jgi:hypothetical protein
MPEIMRAPRPLQTVLGERELSLNWLERLHGYKPSVTRRALHEFEEVGRARNARLPSSGLQGAIGPAPDEPIPAFTRRSVVVRVGNPLKAQLPAPLIAVTHLMMDGNVVHGFFDRKV